MADGRVAKLTISPGIGCTVYHNESGKALSATFFSNTISTDANSKMTVVVASAATVLTKQEVLWQPSYCLRCYSGFFTCKSECCAYPDPTKMADAYTCGIFQSNLGTGQSGTPGMNKCLYTCFCTAHSPRHGYQLPGCYRWRACCSCPRDWCCYSQRFTDLNCCATGGARFTRPSMAMVSAGTTYSGFVHPTPNTPDVVVYNCIGHSDSFQNSQPWMGCQYDCGNGCEPEGKKWGYLCACCVPVLWGGTEVINPAIGFTFPPLYDGTRSGFSTTTGGCWKCDCFQGPMWASQITGIFPGFMQFHTEAPGMMICGCTTNCCLCCRGWCCCGSSAPGFAGIKGRTYSCTDGQNFNEYFWTRCNTPNMNDAMRRVVSPYDDVGIGGTGVPFCYCNGSAPAFSNQQGGNICNMQSARNFIGDCMKRSDGSCGCECSNSCAQYDEAWRSVNWMVDWYLLTNTCSWCHCDICIGRLTQHSSSSAACNEVCCECWCISLCYCRGGGPGSWCCELYQSCQKIPPAITFGQGTWHWASVSPQLCIKPCSDQCGAWSMCQGEQGCQWYCMGSCGCNGIQNASRNGGRLHPFAYEHQSRVTTSGCCCNTGISGHCCWNCMSAYSNCNCGPCQEGCCNTYQPKLTYRCGNAQYGWGAMGGSLDQENARSPKSPYGVNFAFSNGILTHFMGRGMYDYKRNMDWSPSCQGYSFIIPTFSAFGGFCQSPAVPTQRGIPPLFMPVPPADYTVTCDADINGGQANAPIKFVADNYSNAQVHCITKDSTGSLVCTPVAGKIKQWCCTSWGAYSPEFPMKYFAYNPFDDCHYFMLRTNYFEHAEACGWDCTDMSCIRKYHANGTAQQKGAFLPDMKTCLLTNDWMCGIFTINCQALSEFQRNNRCHCICCGENGHNGCCDQCRYWMCYDGGTKFPEYKEYACWGQMFCTGNTVQCGGSCLCCICEQYAYNTWPCAMACTFMAATPCFGLRWNPSDDCFWTDNGGTEYSGSSCFQRHFIGLGTVFFRKVGNFPSIMTDYKYTQPMMCVGCLFRSDNKLWSLPVYNHCEYRWDTFLTCDLKNWNQQEFVKCNMPADQMTGVCDCCVLNLTENYLCRCTDCFMSGFEREGLIELCLSFNQYERTGIVLSENDRIYVKNNDDMTTGKCISFQVWGYEG